MTKLKLKYYFFNVLTDKLDKAFSEDIPLSVVMFDIDFFKKFNDTYGHACGDYVLMTVAKIIKSSIRGEDMASRYGGEEFTVMLYNANRSEAIAVAERIRKNIEKNDFYYQGQHMQVTISGGISIFSAETNPVTSAKVLVDQADRALYLSKRNGRNRVTCAPRNRFGIRGSQMNVLRKPFKYTYFNATLILFAINAVFFMALRIFPHSVLYLSMSVMGMKMHFYWQPLTYMFVHSGWSHFIFNMLALFCFGHEVERAIGSKEFLLFYLFCGILDGLISVALYSVLGYNILLMGASGAIYALLLAFAVIFPRSIISIWGILPVPAPVLVAVYAVIEIFSQIFGGGNVAHLTHLAGFALAWLYLRARMGIKPIKIWKDAYRR